MEKANLILLCINIASGFISNIILIALTCIKTIKKSKCLGSELEMRDVAPDIQQLPDLDIRKSSKL